MKNPFIFSIALWTASFAALVLSVMVFLMSVNLSLTAEASLPAHAMMSSQFWYRATPIAIKVEIASTTIPIGPVRNIRTVDMPDINAATGEMAATSPVKTRMSVCVLPSRSPNHVITALTFSTSDSRAGIRDSARDAPASRNAWDAVAFSRSIASLNWFALSRAS